MGYMGREFELRVSVRTSAHNTPQDAADDALADELLERLQDAVKPILEDPRYAAIGLYSNGVTG